ncbi:hypothetical protein [Propionivibrio sp.]
MDGHEYPKLQQLNKKDITIVVAPERGEDLNVREMARRIMKLTAIC